LREKGFLLPENSILRCVESATLCEEGDLTAVRHGGAKKSGEARPLSQNTWSEKVVSGHPLG